MFPGMNLPTYVPAWAGVKELNIGDDWKAVWADEDELPPDAPVLYAYAVICSEDKGYVTRERGNGRWSMLEGTLVPGETPEAFVKRIALEQAGATSVNVELLGYFELKATSFNPDYPAGTATVRPMYLVTAKKLKDLGRDSAYERRRLPLNEFAMALRNRYPEFTDQVIEAVDRYVIARAK